MRRRSKKTERLYREWGPVRRLYLEDHPRCALPDCPNRSTEVHEITCGSARMAGFVERATWLATCSRCNCERLTDRRAWPYERQLALKMVQDAEGFDLEKFCAAWGRPVTAVDTASVLAEIRQLLL